ncbi:uncharacterized protein SPAPADRAFT_68679 [Spathaspora passalidarum NRRL Y-27907]|uniref:Uncharacterized protein n=1 Tax=Spathaspora passalidarum (strain NRRL Y-27907 / 11-Y1) TaxID=619300 RepID=G3AUP9_SPAPN|nr:uncharacterized protein SPAPADRAFT_68679 [Spathaspora passalidarum NRRL Y-27907]EGW30605.1 hypothetical protein SPAPADRAFT_68679 [Spathaspora passalidarum NRRL Y-27907]
MTEQTPNQSILSPANYYFLLKTENIQPLLETVDQLQHEINENHATIKRLSQIIDYKLNGFPELKLDEDVIRLADSYSGNSNDNGHVSVDEATAGRQRELYSMNEDQENEEEEEEEEEEDNEKDTEPESIDPLRYLLEQKYQLPPPIPESSATDPTKLRMQQLLADISHLSKLQRGKVYRNSQLLEIIQEYEEFIMTNLLPQLREQLHGLVYDQEISNIKHMVDKKHECVEKIYKKYLNNVQGLCKIIDLNKAVIKFMDVEDGFNDKLSHQLASLEALKSNLIGKSDT